MDDGRFAEWLAGVALLTPQQRSHILEILASAASEAGGYAAVGLLPAVEAAPVIDEPAPDCDGSHRAAPEASPAAANVPSSSVASAAESRVEHQGCPRCGSRSVRRWGRANGLPRYRCADCKRTFNGLTGTPLARLRKKDLWQTQAAALIAGESVARTAEHGGVAYTTAFRWRHRFLAAPATDKPNRMVGIVEADEMFILESLKGKRGGLPRKARKRGGKASKRGLSAEQIPVLVARDRSGAMIDAVLPKLDRASVTAALDNIVTHDNELCCDGGKAIVGFARRARIPYHILPAPGKPKPEAPEFHINNVNGYHGRYKEWARRFHGVATKYLDRYLGWRRMLEAIGPTIQPDAVLLAAVGIGPYQQITR